MAKSKIVIVEGRQYLVPRKKYKQARKRVPSEDQVWSYIMENIEEYGRPLEEEGEEEEE